MKVTKCDRCKEICSKFESEPCSVVRWQRYHFDLCEKCTEEFKALFDKFYIPSSLSYETTYDDDWTKKDGETMATSTWGGAGPDCNVKQE